MNDVDGIYSFAVSDNKHIVLARDRVGIKPLYYSIKSDGKSLGFASDKKTLWNGGFKHVEHVRPGNIVTIEVDSLRVEVAKGIAIQPEMLSIEIMEFEECIRKYQEALYNAVKKRVMESDDRLGILISGGVDSTLLAKLYNDIAVKDLGKRLIGYTVGFSDSSDLIVAKKFAEHFSIPHRTKILTTNDVENCLPKVIRAVEDRDFVQIETSVIPYSAMELAARDRIRTMIIGQGPDEMWGGYTWYPNYLKKMGHENLHKQLWEDFLLGDIETFDRESKVARNFGIDLRYPYLDSEVIEVAMSTSPEVKISSPDDKMGKLVHRELASRIGVPKEFAYKAKEAAQIGSGVHEVLDQIAIKHGYTQELCLKLNYFPEVISAHKLGSSARYGYKFADDPSEWQVPANVCLYFDSLAYENGLLDTAIRDRIKRFIRE
jgi:asparagine synthase (glutamine-hydrolysing)